MTPRLRLRLRVYLAWGRLDGGGPMRRQAAVAGQRPSDQDGQQQVEGGRAGWDEPGRRPLAGEIMRYLEHDPILDEALHLV